MNLSLTFNICNIMFEFSLVASFMDHLNYQSKGSIKGINQSKVAIKGSTIWNIAVRRISIFPYQTQREPATHN